MISARHLGKAEAAFVAGLLFLAELELGIEQDQRHVLLDRTSLSSIHIALGRSSMSGHVDHRELHRHADLLRGEADAVARRASSRACRPRVA